MVLTKNMKILILENSIFDLEEFRIEEIYFSFQNTLVNQLKWYIYGVFIKSYILCYLFILYVIVSDNNI